MGTVLYECRYDFSFPTLIPAIILVVFFLLFRGKLPGGKPGKLDRLFLLFAIFLALCVNVVLAVTSYREYHQVVEAYRSGDYQLAEGYVEEFHPMPYTGHDTEHFELSGVYFEYSDYTAMQGYHNTRSHGGVITGDGQHLRIGYVTMDPSGDHVIVYIEELP